MAVTLCKKSKPMNFSLLDCGHDVSACINLMPHPDGSDGLVPAAPPARISVPEGWRPLHVLPDGRILLANARSVGFATRGFISHSAQLDSEPRSCMTVGDTIIVLTDSRMYRLDDSLGILPDAAACAPCVRAVAAGNIRLDTPAVRLGAAYTAGDRFSAADNRAAITAVSDTVHDIDMAARMSGRLWQPVICRVRGLDARGAELFITEPVLLTHPDGSETDIAVSFTSTDGRNLAPATVEVPVWQPQLVWPDGCTPADSGLRAVELLCTPVLYRRDLSKGRVEPRRRADQQWICTVTFGALGTGSGSFGGDGLLRHILDIIGHIDTLAAPAWSGAAPALENPAPQTIPAARSGSIDDDTATLRRILRHHSPAVSYADATARAARTFTAAAMAASGDTVLYADPVIEHPAPPQPQHFFAATAPGAWHAYAEVKYADGSTSVTQTLGLSGAPLTLGPLLSVPAPDAVSITIGVRNAGGLGSTGTYPLVPDPSGQRAVYIAPGARPFTLGDTSPVFAIPQAKPRPVSLKGHIALAHATTPHRPLCALHAGAGRILAVQPAEAAQSAWDYRRGRFHLFADTGLHSIKTDTSRLSMSISPVDSRVLDSPRALAVTDEGLAASMSGDIVLLRGNTLSTIARLPGILGLAYSHSWHELWCIAPHTTHVLCTRHKYGRYTLTTVLDPEGTAGNPGADAIVVDSGGVPRLTGHGEPALNLSVEWQAYIPLGNRRTNISVLHADIAGTFNPMGIALHRCAGRRVCPVPEIQLTVGGPLQSPLGRRFVHIPTRDIHIHITAAASVSSHFRSVEITQ